MLATTGSLTTFCMRVTRDYDFSSRRATRGNPSWFLLIKLPSVQVFSSVSFFLCVPLIRVSVGASDRLANLTSAPLLLKS